jgi:Ser/Thr protein kinase RdoA (MazF antagonist)
LSVSREPKASAPSITMTDPPFDERLWSHYPSILRPINDSRHLLLGFSGSVVWKVATESGPVAVRQLPRTVGPRPPTDHSNLTRVRLHGWSEVPQPLPNNDGETFTKHADSWWDLCTWQPGELARVPIDERHLQAAMHFIARWHAFWTKEKLVGTQSNTADSVQNRQLEWNRLKARDCTTPKSDPLGLQRRTAQISSAIAHRVDAHLHELPLLLSDEPKVYCHGDLHHEHILFTDGSPTGLIDLSCRWDYAAADLARWLSTTTEMNHWPQAVEWYREGAPLSAASERAIPLLAETGLVIAALRWEKWLFGSDPERRYFPRPDLAYDRWRSVVERLEAELM